jgi:cobalt-zinc-cadmium resistance protein CzcA
VLNGIVLISEFNLLEKNGVKDIHERIIKGTRILLRPVLMTAAVASLGFLPMAISHGAGAEVQRPLATVVIGGLVTATVLTLLVLPVLYLIFTPSEKPKPQLSLFQRMRNRKKRKPHAGLLLLFVLVSGLAQSQTISLKAAIDSAMKQNLSVQAAVLRTHAAKAEEKSAWEIPFTSATAEFGQINSTNADNRFGISQELAFPAVYTRQKKALQASTKVSLENEGQVRNEMRKRVTELYYHILVLQERKKLLMYSDSIYSALMQRQEERFKAGETNLLEKTAAESERMQIANQLRMVNTEIAASLLEFDELLHTRIAYTPEATALRLPVNSLPDTNAIYANPAVRLMFAHQELARANYRSVRSRMLPVFSIGYYNMSIVGWQTGTSGDVYYGPSYRFSSVMAGISFPLFFNAGLAHSRTAKLNWTVSQVQYRETVLRKQTELQQLRLHYQSNLETMNYYENNALKQAYRRIERIETGENDLLPLLPETRRGNFFCHGAVGQPGNPGKKYGHILPSIPTV